AAVQISILFHDGFLRKQNLIRSVQDNGYMSDACFRLGYPDRETVKEFRYANTFQVEQTTGPRRVAVGPEDAQLSVMYQLLAPLSPPFLLLYVLHTSRCDSQLSRYQSPPLDWYELN